MTTTATEIAGQMEIGDALKAEGIERVAANGEAWQARAYATLEQLARRMPFLCSDDLRQAMGDDEPHHPNAWGAVMNGAAGLEWLEPTDMTCKSRRASGHSRRIQVWRSMLHG